MWIDDDKIESIKKIADIVELFDRIQKEDETQNELYKEVKVAAAKELKKMLEG